LTTLGSMTSTVKRNAIRSEDGALDPDMQTFKSKSRLSKGWRVLAPSGSKKGKIKTLTKKVNGKKKILKVKKKKLKVIREVGDPRAIGQRGKGGVLKEQKESL